MKEKTVKRFWALMGDGKFDGAGELMEEDVRVWFPNTRELFRGRDRFIAFNKMYPGRWRITVEQILSKEDRVVSAVRVEAEDQSGSFYATSFFTMKGDLIHEITEYWGENSEPPKWRVEKSLSERY